VSVASSLKPAPGETLPFVGGCLSTGCLHGVASIAVIALGTSLGGREGYLLALPFWFFLGAFQWVYLAPLALVLGRLRFVGARRGVWVGGVIVLSLNLFYWVCLGVAGLVYQQKAAEVKRYADSHPITHRELVGTVAAIDAKHIAVATTEGVVSVGLQSTTYYLRRDPTLGNMKTPSETVRVGPAVTVDASSYDGGLLYAEYVTLTGETNSLPSPPQSR